jgi:hypothetical protein
VVNKHDRYIVEIPNPIKSINVDEWFEKLQICYFYGKQNYLFDCFIYMINKQVHINFNTKKQLSRDFVDFVFATLPKNKKDKKRRVFRIIP